MKVSFRSSFAVLIILSLVAVVALMSVLPTEEDNTAAAGIGDYEVTGDVAEPLDYEDLASAFADINSSAGINFTITVRSDSATGDPFVLDNGKNVLIRSSDDGVFVISAADGKRHGTVVSGSLTLDKIILNGSDAGGGIIVSQGGTLIMSESAIILGCKAGNGGAVYSEGIFTMEGGTILGNSTDAKNGHNGGGVYNNGIFTMKNGEIRDNTSYNGGGVYNGPGAVFIMENGMITGNKASFGSGVYNSGTFTLKDGTISGTTVSYGSGVYNTGIFTMDGGNITGGSATEAAGVYNNNTFNMNGGFITDNVASRGGGGISNYGTVTITAGTISGNSAQGGGGAGILSYRIINMSGGSITDNISGGYGGGVSNNGSSNVPVIFTMTGGLIAGNSAMTGGGVCNEYKAQFNLSGNAVISGNSSERGGGVALWDNSTFTIESGTITDNTGTYGGGVYNYIGSIINMTGGTVSDNSGTYGGGIFNWESASINMSGGLITNNNSTYGGGVTNWANSSSTPVAFIMSGGTISYNTAVYGGGMYSNNQAVHNVEIRGGDFSYNTASYGGGIYNASKLIVIGGSIIGNTATDTLAKGSGGGIFTTGFADLIVEDGVVFNGNTAPLLRTQNILPDSDIDGDGIPDIENYKNIGMVELSAPVDAKLNAPAYNNYDINYLIDVICVFIHIGPNESGTVVIKDSASGKIYGALTDDGIVYLPLNVRSVALSATSGSNYEFVKFTIGGAAVSDINNVQVSNGITINAEFLFKGTPGTTDPSQKEYFITASSDAGAKISPDGVQTVLLGSNKTFLFTAGPGSQISTVYIDGVAFSSEVLASGKYTFMDIRSNHTIHVVSSMPVGGDGSIDYGSGKGFGTDSGGTGGSGTWAVLNLLCAVVALFAGIIAVVAGRERFGTDVPDRRTRTAFTLRVLALVIGIAAVILFFLTENWSLPVSTTDGWSLPMFVLLIAALALMVVSIKISSEEAYLSAEESDTITEE